MANLWFKKAGVSNGPVESFAPDAVHERYTDRINRQIDENRRKREAALELARQDKRQDALNTINRMQNAGMDRTTELRNQKYLNMSPNELVGQGIRDTVNSFRDWANKGESEVTTADSYKHATETIAQLSEDQKKLLDDYVTANDQLSANTLTPYQQVGEFSNLSQANKRAEAKKAFMDATGVDEETFNKYAQNASWLKHYNQNNDITSEIRESSSFDRGLASTLDMAMGRFPEIYAMAGTRKSSDPELGRDYYTPTASLSNYLKNTESVVNENIDKIEDPTEKTIKHYLYNGGIEAGKSFADALYGGAVAKGLGLAGKGAKAAINASTAAGMFASGYNASLKDATDRGLTTRQAISEATAGGAIELITEALSMDLLIDVANREGLGAAGNLIWSVIAPTVNEGVEEVNSNVLNEVIDRWLTGDKSKYANNVAYYQSEKYVEDTGAERPMTEEEAKKQANKDYGKSVLEDFIMGTVSGAMGTARAKGQAYLNYDLPAAKAGKNIARNREGLQDALTNAQSPNYISPNEEDYKSNKEYNEAQVARITMQNAIDKKKISNKQARNLYSSVQQAYTNKENQAKAQLKDNSDVKDTQEIIKKETQDTYELSQKTQEEIVNDIEFASTPYELAKAIESVTENTPEIQELIDYKRDELKMYNFTDEQIDNAVTPKKAYEMGQRGEKVTEEQLNAIPEIDRQKVLEENNQQYNKAVLKEHPDAVADKATGKYFVPSEAKSDGQQVVVVDTEGNEHTDFTNPKIKAVEEAYTIVSKDAKTGNNTDQNVFNVTVEQAALATEVAIKSVDATAVQLKTAVGSIFTAASTGNRTWNEFKNKYDYIFKVVNEQAAEKLYNSVRAAARISDRVKQKNTEGRRTSEQAVSKTLRENLPEETTALLEAFAKKIGYNFVASTNKEARGDILPSKRQISIGTNNLSEVYAIVSHEGIAEYLQAHGNEEEVLEIQDIMLNYLEDTMGAAEYQNLIDAYQAIYRTGAKSEIDKNKSRRAAANEMFADTTWTLFSSEEGLNDFTKWVTENNTASEQISIFQKIKDFFGKIFDAVKNYIESGTFNSAEKAALKMDAKQAKDLRDRIFKAMDHAIENAKAAEGVQQGERRHSLFVTKNDLDGILNQGKDKQIRHKNRDFEAGKITLIENEQQLKKKITSVITGPSTEDYNGKAVIFAKMPESLAKKIADKSDFEINLNGYYVGLYENDIRHTQDHDQSVNLSADEWVDFIKDIDNWNIDRTTKAKNGTVKIYVSHNFGSEIAEIVQIPSKATNFVMIKTGYKKGLSLVGSSSSKHPVKGSTPNSPLSNSSITRESDKATTSEAKNSKKSVQDVQNLARHSFAGINSATADRAAMNKAMDLHDQGMDDLTVLATTGWFLGMDNKWKYEIPDNDIEIFRSGNAQYVKNNSDFARYQELLDKIFFKGQEYTQEEYDEMMALDEKISDDDYYKTAKVGKLSDFIIHDELFKAYPWLEHTDVFIVPLPSDTRGAAQVHDNAILLNDRFQTEVAWASDDAFKSTLLHEIQHLIQASENFATGASDNWWAEIKDDRIAEDQLTIDAAKARLEKYVQKAKERGEPTSTGDFAFKSVDRMRNDVNYTIEDHWKAVADWKAHSSIYHYENMISKLERHIDKILNSTDIQLYYNTAGEIEARDTADRRNMTKEQRLQNYPKQDAINVVYADENVSNRRYSKKVGEIEQAAIEHFGTTEDFKFAGYMLPNGQLLDFSGAHWLEGSSEAEKEQFRQDNGMRQVDHEDIYEVMEASGDNRKQFMDRGNIRLNPEAPGFNVSSKTEPTAEQYRQLKEFIREVKRNPYYDASNFYVDIEDTHPNKISYANNLNEDRIINDLKKYYETGEMPQQSSLNDFRYSKKVTLPDGREVKYLADVLNPPEYNRLKRMIDSGYPAFNSSEGDAVYRLDNKLVYARGKENFGISRIVEANVNDDADATYILDWFTDQEEKGATYEQQRIIAEDIFREGTVNQYTNEMFGYVSRYDRPTKRGKSRSDAYYAQREQNRRRVFIKDEQLVDDDIRKSIKVDWDKNDITIPARTYEGIDFFEMSDEEIEEAERQDIEVKAYWANIIHSKDFAGLMFSWEETWNNGKKTIEQRYLTPSTREYDWQYSYGRDNEPHGHYNYYEKNDDVTIYGNPWGDDMASLYQELLQDTPKEGIKVHVLRKGVAEDARQSIKVYGEASPYADSINETKTVQALIGSMNNSLSKADVFEVPNDELIRIERLITNKYKVEGIEEGEISANVAYAFAYMQKSKLDTDYEAMMNYLLNIGDEVIKHSNLKDPDTEKIYQDTRAQLMSHRIKLTDADRAEISNAFGGSWKAAFGALQKAGIKLDNKNGVDIDSIFSEIKQEVLEAAGVDISYGDKPSEQILALIDTMTALEPTAYLWDGANDLDKALSVVTDIVEQYYSAATEQLEKNVVKGTTKGKETLKKAVEKEKARLRGEWSKYKNDKTQEFNEIVAEKNRLIQQQQNEIKKQNELMKTWEKDMAAKDKELSKRTTLTDKEIKATARLQAQQAVQSYKDRQERAKQIDNIKKTGIRLIKWLTNPSDTQHVPPFLQKPLGEFLAAIDFLPKNPKADAKSTLSWHQRMNALREELIKIKNAEEEGDDQVRAYFANNIVAKELISMMDDFLGKEEWDEYTQSYVLTKRGASKVSNLDAKDLATLNKIMSALSASINNLNQTYANDQFKEISKLSKESVEEIDKLPARKDMQKLVGKAFNFLNFDELEPITWFEGLGAGAKSVFQELRDGFDLKTKHVRESDEYMAKAKEDLGISDKELSTWKNQLHKFELFEGTVMLNTTQIMSLYEILKRKQGRPHVAVGGIKAADFEYKDGKLTKKHHQAKAVHIMSSEAQAIIDTLTEEQKALADKMQQYMASKCASWGNRVTEKMYGYKKYEEKDYFPLKTDAHSRATTASSDNNVSYYTIKNASFTKPITPMANNAVVLEDIFDVFTDHVVNMADYDAYVMPIADAMRWFNYSERIINATEPDELNEAGARMDYLGNMQESIDRVYGDAGLNYFRQFIKDINGDYAGRGGKSEILSSLMSMYKAQAVGANVRVVIQQPTAVVRAADVIEPKYLMQAMTSLPKAMQYAKKAQANSEIAYWKAQGYYETYLGQSFKEIITGDTTLKDRINDWSGKFAGLADDLSWGIMYHAAELKVKATQPQLKEGTAAFDKAATKIFDDIVDHTQVVDTIFHKSQWMRSQELGHKMTSAFMAEPTKTYNMLYRAYRTAKLSGDKKIAMRKLKDVALIFVFEQMLNAIVTAVWDSLRDDEKEDYLSGLKAHFKENAVDNLNLLKLLPLAKDIFSFFEGYDATSYVYDGMESLVETILADKKYGTNLITGEKQSKTPYGIIYQNAKAVSQMSGIPVANVMRDVKSIYNAVNGFWGGEDIVTTTATQKKISKARETSRVSEVFDAGDLSAIKSEVQQAYENGVANSKDQSESDGWSAARDMLKEQFQRQIAEQPENKAAIENRYKTLLKYTKKADGKGGYRELTDKEIENSYINKWLAQ